MKNNVVIFNSEFEAGLRALILLTTTFPNSLDLHRLVQFEYLMVHSGDVGGPESLHPPVPLRSGELLVRRRLLEQGIQLMMSRGLIERLIKSSGIEYLATDNAAPFVNALTAPYALKLIHRARWVSKKFSDIAPSKLTTIMRSFFEHWTTEFHSVGQGRSSDT